MKAAPKLGEVRRKHLFLPKRQQLCSTSLLKQSNALRSAMYEHKENTSTYFWPVMAHELAHTSQRGTKIQSHKSTSSCVFRLSLPLPPSRDQYHECLMVAFALDLNRTERNYPIPSAASNRGELFVVVFHSIHRYFSENVMHT